MFYRLFRAFLRLTIDVFFRRIEAPGLESVPKEGPLLFVANHGSALMDSMILLRLVPRPVSFLAKHTLFSMPVIGLFARGIGGIPVYRRQDAPGEMSRNEAMFEACLQRLEGGGAICLFPEGISHDLPRLQRIKTGAARIFFRALGRTGSPVKVIPVGINYEQKETFRSRVLVVFGRPVPTEDLGRLEEGHPGDGVEELSARIEKALEALLPGLDSWEELEFIREIQHLTLGGREASLAKEAPVLKRFIEGYHAYRELDPEAVELVRRGWEAYRRQLRRFSLNDRQVELAEAPARAAGFLLTSAAVVLLGLPLAAVGLVVHLLPYALAGWLERRFNRHPDQAATFKFISGLALYLVTYLLVLAIPLSRGGWKAALPGVVVLPLTGWAALLVSKNRLRLAESARALVLALPGGHALQKIRIERQRILEDVADLIRKHPPSGVGEARGRLREVDG